VRILRRDTRHPAIDLMQDTSATYAPSSRRVEVRIHGTACLAGALVAFAAGSLSAQTAPDAASGLVEPDTVTYVLPPVHVSVVVAEQVTHTPGAAAIFGLADYQQLRPYTMHDVLDFVAGVRTIEDDILALHPGIGVRGAPPRRSRKTLLLEDGVPINLSSYLDAGSRYTPPMERLERVEVLKGAGQLIHGPLNNHGIVNFRNRRAGPEPETTFEVSGGELHSFRRHALHSRRIGPTGMVFAYTGMNADGTFDVETHQFDDFFGSVEWEVDSRHDVAASLTHYRMRTDGYDESNLTPAQFALHPRGKLVLGEGREFNNTAVDYLKGALVHDYDAGGWLRLSTRLFATELDRPRFQTRGVAPTSGGVMEGRVRTYRTGGIESRFEFGQFDGLGATHAIQAGLRHERHAFDDARPVGRPGEVLNERQRGNVFAVAGVDGYTRNGRLTTYGAMAFSGFVQDAVRVRDWLLIPGVRLESYTQTRAIDFWPGNADEGGSESDRHTLILPGVSALYHGFGETQVYAGLHRGYAPASARTEEFPLEPETGVNGQVGVRSTALRGISLDLAAFYNRIRNTLIRDHVDSFGDALFVNSADSRVYGLDVGVSVNSAAYTVSSMGLFGQLAYNYSRSEFTTAALAGNRVPEVPEHAGSVTFGVEQGERWQVSATVSHFGQFYSDKENTLELQADGGLVPSRTLLSARVGYSLPMAPATLWVQGRNLTDRLYISDVQDGLRPGAPRSIMGGVNVTF
jgi:Fe(3+) dicitrate transport protein